MTRVRRGVGVAGVVLAGVALAACGAPTVSPAEVIATVPYDLSAPSRSADPVPTSTPSVGPRVYLVRDDVLVVGSPLADVADGTGARDSAARVLDQLVDGPTGLERTSGLSTALGPDVQLSLVDITNGRATVDIRAGEQAPGAGRLPLAVGQVVLTLTSIDGVDEVVLISDGTPIAAPLPGGALTDQPLRAGDYTALTVAPTTPPG